MQAFLKRTPGCDACNQGSGLASDWSDISTPGLSLVACIQDASGWPSALARARDTAEYLVTLDRRRPGEVVRKTLRNTQESMQLFPDCKLDTKCKAWQRCSAFFCSLLGPWLHFGVSQNKIVRYNLNGIMESWNIIIKCFVKRILIQTTNSSFCEKYTIKQQEQSWKYHIFRTVSP